MFGLRDIEEFVQQRLAQTAELGSALIERTVSPAA